MKILDKIVENMKSEIIRVSRKTPISLLENKSLFSRQCISLKDSIKNSSTGIICEFKRRSPSNENINYKFGQIVSFKIIRNNIKNGKILAGNVKILKKNE